MKRIQKIIMIQPTLNSTVKTSLRATSVASMKTDMLGHRFKKIDPPHHVTREECQEMIDNAIRKHNRNAGIISMFVGFFVLGLFSEGLLRLIGVIPPLVPWLHPHL